MATIILDLPNDLRDEVARWTSREALAEADWIIAAVREKLAACSEMQYLEERATRGNQAAYEEVLAKVPAVAPSPGDER